MNVPSQLPYDVSRDALLLYLFATMQSDSLGVCGGAYSAGAQAGLSRPEMDAAIDELTAKGYAEEHNVRVPIAATASGIVATGTRVGLRLLGFTRPARIDRLSPTEWESLREQVFERDDHTCQYCGAKGGVLECDHVVPISKGGTNEPGNLATACSTCNRQKRAKLIAEWRRTWE